MNRPAPPPSTGRSARAAPPAPARGRAARTARGVALVGLAALVLCAAVPGCTRARYRMSADRESFDLLRNKAQDSPRGLAPFSIYAGPESRMFDPLSPDRPPMPPDDPESHKLMHYVDGKRGWPHWHRNGETPTIDYGQWRAYLPYDDEGRVVLDREATMRLALTHSRTYRRELEDLYLSALDVTFERFRFDAQFFAGNDTFLTADGPLRAGSGGQSSTELGTDTGLEVRRLTTTGGQLVADVANSFVWQFAGPDTESASTLIDFAVLQPLLRGGGRARILERLTLSERTLLANVRQMEFYRQGFYASVMTGVATVEGPQRRGGVFGGAGLEGFSGVGAGGFGRVGQAVASTASIGAVEAGGFFGLLQDQLQIRNQETNVAALRESVAQLEAKHEAGRIDRFQVELTRQSLYNAQSRLLSAKTAYEARLDQFKITLGLPPDLPLLPRDALLERFDLIPRATGAAQEEADALLVTVRGAKPEQLPALRADLFARLDQLRTTVDERLETLSADAEELQRNLPARRQSLRLLADRPELTSGEVDRRAYQLDALDERVARLAHDRATLEAALDGLWQKLAAWNEATPGDAAAAPAARQTLIDTLTDLSSRLLELMLLQARTRLEAVVLVPIELDGDAALETARANRLDWMNARAAVVDTWRLIEFNANDLESVLNLRFEGDVTTTGDRPFGFHNKTGRLRVGAEFDAPLTRLAERNLYRQALLDYQVARRNYMAFEDRVSFNLRTILRTISLNQINFELRRAAVLIAITQVELSQLRLNQPPRPGAALQPGDAGGRLSDTTARDLISALNDLLEAQNNFLGVWVNYEVLRIGLDLELGTMQLDGRGMWIDPGPITGESTSARGAAEAVEPEPLPPGIREEDLPRLLLEVPGPDAAAP